MNKIWDMVSIFLLAILIVIALALLMAFPTMIAWNHVMPHVFKLPEIAFMQAFCLNFLCGILIKSQLKCQCKSED